MLLICSNTLPSLFSMMHTDVTMSRLRKNRQPSRGQLYQLFTNLTLSNLLKYCHTVHSRAMRKKQMMEVVAWI